MESTVLWFQRLLFKRRWRRVQQSGVPESFGPETLAIYLPLLRPQLFRRYRPDKGLRITVDVALGEYHELLKFLDLSIDILFHRQTLGVRQRLERTKTSIVRLDDYLVDEQQHTIPPKEAIHEIAPRIERLRELLTEIQNDPEEQYRYNYYQRHYTHLLHEIHHVLMGILEAS